MFVKGGGFYPGAPFTDKIFQVLLDDHSKNLLFLFCLYSSWTSVINIFHLYDSLCWQCPRPPVILVMPTSSSPTHRFRKLVSPIGDLIGLGINPQRIRILATFINHFFESFLLGPLPKASNMFSVCPFNFFFNLDMIPIKPWTITLQEDLSLFDGVPLPRLPGPWLQAGKSWYCLRQCD